MPEMLKRWQMRRIFTEQPTSVGTQASEAYATRSATQQDGPLLGRLLYDAYHGTIDDEGETPDEAQAEIESVLAGKHGPLLSTASFIAEGQGRALGASIVTDWTDDRTDKKQPLLAFLMVHPDATGQGMATFLLDKTLQALQAHGEREIVLFVTVGNGAAQHIYQKLGFVVEEEFEINRTQSE